MEALSTLGHFLLTLIVGLLVLTVLVFVHELGHYLVAKHYGMRVNAFAIFMGGVRKTDLYHWLERPLAPTKVVWGVFVASFAAAMVGALVQINALYLCGLLVAGVVVPVWVILRLAALYHVRRSQVIGTLVKSLAVGAVVLAFGTKLQGVDANMVVGVAAGASLIALAIVYYLPVQMREPEDDKQGFGEITIHKVEMGQTEQVPVRFRPIWSKEGSDGTEFSLLLLPLGGFAQISGMHAKADGSEVAIDGGFYSKPPLQRLAVLFAGPLFSVLFGLLLLVGLYSTSGKEARDLRPIVGGVSEGSGAEKAGLKEGDEIVSIDGEHVADFYSMTVVVKDNWVQRGDKREPVPTVVEFRRDGQLQKVTVVPMVDEQPEPLRNEKLDPIEEREIQARLGIIYGSVIEPIGTGQAVREAVMAPVMMVGGIVNMIIKPKTASDNVAGPTAMAKVTSAAVSEGSYYVIWFAAMLSISLGVMNLLPIVPLDGGQMVIAFVEMLRGGRRLSLHVQNMLVNSGIALLVLMMLAVSAVDLGRSADANKRAAKQEQVR